MIQGKLVNLIALEEEHIEILRDWRTSPEVYSYLFNFNFISKKQQKKWYEDTTNDTSKVTMIIEDKQGKPLGFIYLSNIDWANRKGEWGFFIGSNEHRYGGYAVEAEFMLMSYVFDYLNLNKLYCLSFAFNKKVLSMHRQFGFKQEGILKAHTYHLGHYQDVVIMSVFREDYEGNKEKFKNLFNKLINDYHGEDDIDGEKS
jgi:UDP-4-amino-4,6-dideoxy-N-acetyl-beta-L-altrosamine N-acetyltransferase